jgi:DNA-binding response OmpR family regulator
MGKARKARRERILIVEDEAPLAAGLADLLAGEGYATLTAADGRQALELYRRDRPTLVLLDIMIPGKSGYEVCREIRRQDPRIPVLMLTAKGQEVDKIVKPFGVGELLARIRAALRRREAAAKDEAGEPLAFGDVRIDPQRMEGRKGERRFPLSARELALLRLFLSRRGQVLDRATLLDQVWGLRYQGTTRTLDQHIAQLRKKIERDPSRPHFLLTVHGVGYRFGE